MSKTLCAVLITLLLTTMRISAHHAFDAEYDENKRISVSGTVTSFKWINPHAWLYVDGKDERGKVTKWSFEMGSTGGLTARGWKKTDLKAGDRITIEGFRAKNGKNVANPTIITLPDGQGSCEVVQGNCLAIRATCRATGASGGAMGVTC